MLSGFVFIAMLIVAGTAFAAEPAGLSDAFGNLITSVQAGKAMAIAAAAVWLLCTLLKTKAGGNLLTKVPVRYRLLVPLALSALAGLLDQLNGGVGWLTALGGTLSIAMHEFGELLTGARAEKRSPSDG